MAHARDISLTHPGADDVNPVVASRVLLPQDADPSTSNLSEIPLERFVGRGLVVHVSGFGEDAVIPYSAVADQIDDVAPGDVVLFDTGWALSHSADRARGIYEQRHPTLDPGIVAALIVRGVLVVGIDAPRIDPPDVTPGPGAHMLAAANGLLCVNLVNLDQIDFSSPLITLTIGERLTRTSHRVDVTAVAIG